MGARSGDHRTALTTNLFLERTLCRAGIKHLIAPKDIPFSNSRIEAFNKIIKHQFLLPQNLANKGQLEIVLKIDVVTYNCIRPQLSLHGNTSSETFSGKTLDISHYKTHFYSQKVSGVISNYQNRCIMCK